MAESQSVDWSILRHAYGDATSIPALLKQLEHFPAETDWQAEPWFSLWSALYHQGDIYPASLAAVPAIVNALSQSPGKATLSFYLLPASIAVADAACPVQVPATIRDAFTASLATLGQLAAAALPALSDPHAALAAKAALLVSQGKYEEAGEMLGADA